MAADWEYTVVELPPATSKDREAKFTELLNRVASYGWRLVSVTADPGQAGRHTYAYFERRAQGQQGQQG